MWLASRRRTSKREETNLEVLRDFTDEALEGELADEELSRLLVATNFTEGDGSGPEAMGLLHSSSGGLWKQIKYKKNLYSILKLTAVLRADDLAASCLRGALPPVDLRAVCLVRAIGSSWRWWWWWR